MTSRDYNGLTIGKRADILWKDGTRLFEKVVDKNKMMVIYAVSTFFVEICYFQQDFKVSSIKALETSDDWNWFLRSIELQELF